MQTGNGKSNGAEATSGEWHWNGHGRWTGHRRWTRHTRARARARRGPRGPVDQATRLALGRDRLARDLRHTGVGHVPADRDGQPRRTLQLEARAGRSAEQPQRTRLEVRRNARDTAGRQPGRSGARRERQLADRRAVRRHRHEPRRRERDDAGRDRARASRRARRSTRPSRSASGVPTSRSASSTRASSGTKPATCPGCAAKVLLNVGELPAPKVDMSKTFDPSTHVDCETARAATRRRLRRRRGDARRQTRRQRADPLRRARTGRLQRARLRVRLARGQRRRALPAVHEPADDQGMPQRSRRDAHARGPDHRLLRRRRSRPQRLRQRHRRLELRRQQQRSLRRGAVRPRHGRGRGLDRGSGQQRRRHRQLPELRGAAAARRRVVRRRRPTASPRRRSTRPIAAST